MPKYNKTAQSLHLDNIKGDILDDLLYEGWYRLGPSIFTSHYINYNAELYSAIWLRTVLVNYTLSKSLRKLNRKNKALFTHNTEPYTHSEDLDELYIAYSTTFKGDLPASLSSYMIDSLGLDIYETWLVKIYSEGKLIACSIFDVGSNCVASIFGFYDPIFSTMSLGLYTMMLEIEYCQQHDMDYYYVGYFVPGNPRFDYKLRLGHVEFLDFKSREWLSFDAYRGDDIPVEITKNKLSELHSKLHKNHQCEIYKNAFIDAHIIEYFPMNYVEAPLLVIFETLSLESSNGSIVICTYDVRAEKYLLQLCYMIHPNYSNYNPEWLKKLDTDTFKYELVIKKTIKRCKTIAPIQKWLVGEKKELQQKSKI